MVGSKWLCLFGLFFLCEEGSIGLNFFKDIISFYVCNNFMNKKCGDLFFSLKVIVFDFWMFIIILFLLVVGDIILEYCIFFFGGGGEII